MPCSRPSAERASRGPPGRKRGSRPAPAARCGARCGSAARRSAARARRRGRARHGRRRGGSAAGAGSRSRRRRTPRSATGAPTAAGEEAGQALGAEHLVGERGGLAELDSARGVGVGAGHGARRWRACGRRRRARLHRRALVGPGAVVERDHPVLDQVGEVEEGGVAVAPSTPAANQRCARRSSTQRVRCSGIGPSGPSRPTSADGDAGGRAAVAGAKEATSRMAKPRRSSWPRRAGSRSGRPARPKRRPSRLEPPQELEEVHGLGGRQARSDQAAVADRVGHATSSWLAGAGCGSARRR